MKQIRTQVELNQAINLDRAIIYLLVNWSGQERLSRSVIHQVFNKLDKNEIPVFQIDCSDQTHIATDWLIKQKNECKDFIFGGYGEIILISKGVLIDFINYPGRLGLDKVKEIIHRWSSKHDSFPI